VAAGLVPAAYANDLGGSIRYPASACGLFGLKPTRARNPIGPQYGDVVSGWAVEHAVTRSVRDSAAILDATAGPAPGDPYAAPPTAGPFAMEVGADPGRLRIAFSGRTASGESGHPDCMAALDDAVALCASLGHELVEADVPSLEEVGGAIGTAFNAATAWIVAYWTRIVGRPPADDELEPLTRAFWEMGRHVTAAEYLLAVEDVQRYSRRLAAFLTGFDLFLSPTLATPPLPLGEMTSTPDDPMSVPLWWNADELPIGVHFLGRFGDEATLFRLAAQLEQARPWAGRLPPTHASTAA
jgi:amidase